MQLSEHFTLGEFTTSATGARLRIENKPGPVEIENCKLVASRLELIRPFSGPIVPLSGFRCDKLNKAVGGSKTSAHRFGLAVDMRAPRLSNFELARLCVEKIADFDQVILEFPDRDDPQAGWVHLGFTKTREPRRQTLTARKVGGRTRYYPGHSL
jgi:zinc D-Ala-D-Ala carboxypeptidase